MIKKFTILLLAAALAGCASNNKQPVPRRGEVVAQGTGTLSFRAPDRGLVSVYDVNNDAIIHTSGVGPNSVIALNPSTGNITMTDSDHAGTQNVYSGLNKSHRYEIWFIPARGGTYTTAPTQWDAR
jgi:hypothetical protein